MATRPLTSAKFAAMAFLREGRAAGWRSVKIDVEPDGSVRVSASMGDDNGADDFDGAKLRMGPR